MPPKPNYQSDRRTSAKRRRKLHEQTEKRILALQERYYPPLLASIVLACALRQRAGDYKRCCRKRLCAPCAARESHTKALQQLEAFRAFSPHEEKARQDKRGRPRKSRRKLRIQHAVFTLPPALRPLVQAPGGLQGFRKAVLATLRELHGPHVAGVMNLHPIGDDPSKFHPHLDVIINAWAITDGKVVLKRPRLDYEKARRVYARNLEHEFDLETGSVPVIDVWFDVKRGYTKSNPRKVWHIIRYSAREVYQPAWAKLDPRAQNGEDWLYQAKKEELPRRYEGRKVIQNLLRIEEWLHGQQRRVWFGYMKDKNRAKALQLFSTTPRVGEAPEEEQREDAHDVKERVQE